MTLNVVVMSGMTYFTYGVRGNGVLSTRTFELAKFDHVVLVGTGNARITTGQLPFLEITTDENMFPLLEIEVSDGKLVIRHYWGSAKVLLSALTSQLFQVDSIHGNRGNLYLSCGSIPWLATACGLVYSD